MFIKICQRRNISQLEADFVYLYRTECRTVNCGLLAYVRVCMCALCCVHVWKESSPFFAHSQQNFRIHISLNLSTRMPIVHTPTERSERASRERA